MGREIRRVPPGWEHPRWTAETSMRGGRDIGEYAPTEDAEYTEASDEWVANCIAWSKGEYVERRESLRRTADDKYYWDYAGNPPDTYTHRHRKWTDEEATHYQMYETVSEGCPVTPVFATLQELEDYLVDVGEGWGPGEKQKYSRAAAHAFCSEGWAPSVVVIGGEVLNGIEGLIKHKIEAERINANNS